MNSHIFLPGVKIDQIQLVPEYEKWLFGWLQEVENNIVDGDVSASMCLQGAISELVLYKRVKTDWVHIMEDFLSGEDNLPLAYSPEYGKRLYRFGEWSQKEVYAIHARWWINQACTAILDKQEVPFAKLIQNLIQDDFWIYNPRVSPTKLEKRAKSEIMMSMAMGIELLDFFGTLEPFKASFEGRLSSEARANFLSAEYFRLKALEALHAINLAPVGIGALIALCEIGNGYSDFSMTLKKDEDMGTASRTMWDKVVPSPLAGLYAYHLSSILEKEARETVLTRLASYGKHLRSDPMDIAAFTIRSLNTPFGTDITPLEIFAASSIMAIG